MRGDVTLYCDRGHARSREDSATEGSSNDELERSGIHGRQEALQCTGLTVLVKRSERRRMIVECIGHNGRQLPVGPAESRSQIRHEVAVQAICFVGLVPPEPLPADITDVRTELETNRQRKEPTKLYLMIRNQWQLVSGLHVVVARQWC